MAPAASFSQQGAGGTSLATLAEGPPALLGTGGSLTQHLLHPPVESNSFDSGDRFLLLESRREELELEIKKARERIAIRRTAREQQKTFFEVKSSSTISTLRRENDHARLRNDDFRSVCQDIAAGTQASTLGRNWERFLHGVATRYPETLSQDACRSLASKCRKFEDHARLVGGGGGGGTVGRRNTTGTHVVKIDTDVRQEGEANWNSKFVWTAAPNPVVATADSDFANAIACSTAEEGDAAARAAGPNNISTLEDLVSEIQQGVRDYGKNSTDKFLQLRATQQAAYPRKKPSGPARPHAPAPVPTFVGQGGDQDYARAAAATTTQTRQQPPGASGGAAGTTSATAGAGAGYVPQYGSPGYESYTKLRGYELEMKSDLELLNRMAVHAGVHHDLAPKTAELPTNAKHVAHAPGAPATSTQEETRGPATAVRRDGSHETGEDTSKHDTASNKSAEHLLSQVASALSIMDGSVARRDLLKSISEFSRHWQDDLTLSTSRELSSINHKQSRTETVTRNKRYEPTSEYQLLDEQHEDESPMPKPAKAPVRRSVGSNFRKNKTEADAAQGSPTLAGVASRDDADEQMSPTTAALNGLLHEEFGGAAPSSAKTLDPVAQHHAHPAASGPPSSRDRGSGASSEHREEGARPASDKLAHQVEPLGGEKPSTTPADSESRERLLTVADLPSDGSTILSLEKSTSTIMRKMVGASGAAATATAAATGSKEGATGLQLQAREGHDQQAGIPATTEAEKTLDRILPPPAQGASVLSSSSAPGEVSAASHVEEFHATSSSANTHSSGAIQDELLKGLENQNTTSAHQPPPLHINHPDENVDKQQVAPAVAAADGGMSKSYLSPRLASPRYLGPPVLEVGGNGKADAAMKKKSPELLADLGLSSEDDEDDAALFPPKAAEGTPRAEAPRTGAAVGAAIKTDQDISEAASNKKYESVDDLSSEGSAASPQPRKVVVLQEQQGGEDRGVNVIGDHGDKHMLNDSVRTGTQSFDAEMHGKLDEDFDAAGAGGSSGPLGSLLREARGVLEQENFGESPMPAASAAKAAFQALEEGPLRSSTTSEDGGEAPASDRQERKQSKKGHNDRTTTVAISGGGREQVPVVSLDLQPSDESNERSQESSTSLAGGPRGRKDAKKDDFDDILGMLGGDDFVSDEDDDASIPSPNMTKHAPVAPGSTVAPSTTAFITPSDAGESATGGPPANARQVVNLQQPDPAQSSPSSTASKSGMSTPQSGGFPQHRDGSGSNRSGTGLNMRAPFGQAFSGPPPAGSTVAAKKPSAVPASKKKPAAPSLGMMVGPKSASFSAASSSANPSPATQRSIGSSGGGSTKSLNKNPPASSLRGSADSFRGSRESFKFPSHTLFSGGTASSTSVKGSGAGAASTSTTVGGLSSKYGLGSSSASSLQVQTGGGVMGQKTAMGNAGGRSMGDKQTSFGKLEMDSGFPEDM